jgi:hypothetical protein
MRPTVTLKHEFVEYVPSELQDGVVYVSIPFATVVHRCCCGCGNQVVTPLTPTDWELVYDGETISLDPSIGNWSFPCRSHYWIRRNQVRWAAQWSDSEVEGARAHDRRAKQLHYHPASAETEPTAQGPPMPSWRRWLARWRR